MTDGDRQPEDAFGILSHELRLSVLEALEAEFEAGSFAADPIPFSELADRVGADDSGNFNYHLNTLRDGGFVERVGDGYRIRQAGVRIVRAIRAGNVVDEGSPDPVDVEESCPYCDGPVELATEDDWLFVRCRACPGAFAQEPHLPEGTIAGFEITPASLRNRSPAERFRMAFALGLQAHRLFAAGICPDCGGTTTVHTLERCADHTADESGVCDACGRTVGEFFAVSCNRCGRSLMSFPAIVVATDPGVVAAMYARGLDVTDRTWRALAWPPDWPCRQVDTEPATLEYAIAVPIGADLRVRIDEELSVTVLE